MSTDSDISVSVDFKLGEKIGALSTRLTGVEDDVREIKGETKTQTALLNTLVARDEFRKASWKKVAGGITLIGVIVESGHQLASWLHR